MAKDLVSDWNGTILKYPDEGKLWGTVGLGVAKDWKNPKSAIRALVKLPAVLKAKKRYDAGEVGYDAIFRAFDEAISGVREERVDKLVEKYVNETANSGAVDCRFIGLANIAKSWGGRTGIFSIGYEKAIKGILEEKGAIDTFDFIRGNDIVWTKDRGYGYFKLSFFNNKGSHLPGLLSGHDMRPDNTAYFGDTKEDDGCFEEVDYPILSPYADDDFREEFSRKYPNGFILEDKWGSFLDCADYIKSK